MRSLHTVRIAWAAIPPPVRGALWMILANVFFTLMNTLVRELSARYGLFELLFVRSLFGLIFVLLLVWPAGIRSLKTTRPALQVVRGLLGFVAMYLWFFAVSNIPLAQATAINFSAPIFAAVLIAVFLGERMRARRWTATALGFVGMLIVLRPGFAEFSLAIGAALCASMLMAVGATVVKVVARTDHPNSVVLYVPLFLSVFAVVPALLDWTPPTGADLALMAVLGLVGTLAHHCWVRAFAVTEATAVLPYDFVRLPMMALAGYALYAELPDLWTWVGAAVILGSSVYMAHRESRAHRRRQ